jgi:hypothetical protein
MKNRLPGISPVVDDQAISSLVKSPLLGKVSGDEEQVPDKLAISFVHTLYVPDMFIGHNQDVRRRLRIDVFECDGHIIAVYELRRDLAINDLAKKTVWIQAHGVVLP